MSDLIENDLPEDNDSGEVSIATLRQVAKYLGVPAQRSWSKEDYIQAIKLKQANNNVASLVLDGSGNAPKPGFARIIVHRDPTPGHRNTPIHVGLNGKMYQVPRGIEVEIEKEYINVLKDAVDEVLAEQDGTPGRGNATEVWQKQASYPFQVIAITPGDAYANKHDSRSQTYKVRKAFFDKFGQWPTDAELKDFKKNLYDKA
jgi:hypothetical protein